MCYVRSVQHGESEYPCPETVLDQPNEGITMSYNTNGVVCRPARQNNYGGSGCRPFRQNNYNGAGCRP